MAIEIFLVYLVLTAVHIIIYEYLRKELFMRYLIIRLKNKKNEISISFSVYVVFEIVTYIFNQIIN